MTGDLKPGEKLPSERELIDVFETSRRTLREAFRVLEQKGLISIKIGAKGGTFVANQVGEKLVETLTLFVKSQSISQADLAEFRALTEGAVVELLSFQADKDVFDTIEAAMVDIEALLDGGTVDKQKFVEKEMALHQLLADRCGNAMYSPILKTIYDLLLRDAFMMDHIDKAYVESAMADWREILAALRAGTAKAAGELMKRHILGFARN